MRTVFCCTLILALAVVHRVEAKLKFDLEAPVKGEHRSGVLKSSLIIACFNNIILEQSMVFKIDQQMKSTRRSFYSGARGENSTKKETK